MIKLTTIQKYLDDLVARYTPPQEGVVADYIPQSGKASLTDITIWLYVACFDYVKFYGISE